MSERFKQMNFKEKIEYIWMYYRLKIFFVILGVFIITSVLNTMVFNPPATPYCNLVSYGYHIEENKTKELTDLLTNALVTDKEANLNVPVLTYTFGQYSPEISYELGQQFTTMVMSKQLDVIIAKKEDFEFLIGNGTIIPLEDFLTEKEMENFTDFINGTNEIDNVVKPYGVSLKNNQFLKNYVTENLSDGYMGIIRTSERKKEAKKLFDLLCK